jgi:hypothetical protein
MACTNDMKEVMILPKKELRPTQIGDSVTLLYSDSTQLKVVLKANRMLIFNKNVTEPYTLLPKGLFVTFFDDNNVNFFSDFDTFIWASCYYFCHSVMPLVILISLPLANSPY